MEVRPRELRVYQTETDGAPFREWMRCLQDKKARAAIDFRLDRLGQGNFGDVAPVGEGVFELRIHLGPGYRVYFGEDGPRVILLLIAGTKSTQPKDIRAAKRYWRDYNRNTEVSR